MSLSILILKLINSSHDCPVCRKRFVNTWPLKLTAARDLGQQNAATQSDNVSVTNGSTQTDQSFVSNLSQRNAATQVENAKQKTIAVQTDSGKTFIIF